MQMSVTMRVSLSLMNSFSLTIEKSCLISSIDARIPFKVPIDYLEMVT
jgi:hypothetical protein